MGQRGPGAKPVQPALEITPLPLFLDGFGTSKPIEAPLPGRTRADRLINWIGTLIVPGGTHAGRNFKLRPWQRAIVKDVYRTNRQGRRTVRQVLLSMGRKNGKTGLAAALALAHLAGPEAVRGGQVLSGAADRAQAAIVYGAMKAMILAHPKLRDRLILRDFKK